MKKIHDLWTKTNIKNKIRIFTGSMALIVIASMILNFGVVKFSLSDVSMLMDSNSRTSECMAAVELEAECFEKYVKNPTDVMKEELYAACQKTQRAINRLPYNYSQMSEMRYAKTWSLKNSYEAYGKVRDEFLEWSASGRNYIKELYRIYEMQKYIKDYAKELVTYTIEDENAVYLERLPVMKGIPYFVLGISIVFLAIISFMSRMSYKVIFTPIVKLVEASKQIASNNFFIKDVENESEDEMGDLVHAFNKMKYATGEYILMLEEKRTALDLLHKEEIKRLEVEKSLESIRFELLMSQMNPHFLFNTLNVISGMALLENAETTEKMIKALSSIFRYNLKTPEAEVALSQELKIIENYMYLQHMRFGDRITYTINNKVDAEKVIVPTCSLQPLVENAIIHGIAVKEEGGTIEINIYTKEENVIIEVADNGVGMSEESLAELLDNIENNKKEKAGIGLRNVCQRIKRMYKNGNVDIKSTINKGTTIRLVIPQEGEAYV